jgi:hypothetical protein
LGVGAKNAIPSRSTQKMFYSYTGSKHQKICPIGYPPNKCCKFLLLSLKGFVAKKKHVAMQKLFIKKLKMDKCLIYLKQWVLRCPSKKEKREKNNKIAHVFLQSCFQVLKERCFQGAKLK